MLGGIDLGGTKIEACLFDSSLNVLHVNRISTPRSSYQDLLDAILSQCLWLEELARDRNLKIGIGVPGLIDRQTGLSTTANLPATGKPLQLDLNRILGRALAVENDCKCFALSESHDGSGSGANFVLGLILGTGIGGGFCMNRSLLSHNNGVSGEVGHIPMPAHLISRWKLPVLSCGCGRTGCYETLVSGPGMARLCLHLTGRSISAPHIVDGFLSGDSELAMVFNVWLTLLCELIQAVQLVIDPDCIVFGGGLSKIPDLAERVSEVFSLHQLPGIRAPIFAKAKYGDSSGVRGAAILAKSLI